MALPPALISVAGGQRAGAFSASETRSAGYTDRQIRTLLRRGRWSRVRRGVYVDADLVGNLVGDGGVVQAEAAVLAFPGAAISHRSAASWWGLRQLRRESDPARVTRRPGSVTGRAARPVLVHVAELPGAQVRTRHGIMVTSVERTVLDVAREYGPLAGLVSGDGALLRGMASRERIDEALWTMRNWPGVLHARWVGERLDARAETPLESLCRFRWLQAGLPAPHLQAWIFDEDGFVGIVDGLLENPFVAYEADGMRKYDEQLDGPETLRREKLRQERAESTGLVFRRYTWPQVWWDADWSLRRMQQAREEAAHRPPPRARIYVGDRYTPPPDPWAVLASGDPARLGLRLLYDGLR